MGGLLIIIISAIYFGLAIYISLWAVKRPIWKGISLLSFALVPSADAIYGRLTFQGLCEREAGLKILRVEEAEGFRDLVRTPESDWITKYHFQFVEGTLINDLVERKEYKNGNVQLITSATPIAKYELQHQEVERTPYIWKYTVIERPKEHEKLGEFVNILYLGGWVERMFSGMYSAKTTVASCQPHASYEYTIQLVLSTLKPTKGVMQ